MHSIPWPCVSSTRAPGHFTLNLTFLDILADRGEGANHAILDVFDFAEIVTPHLVQRDVLTNSDASRLRMALDQYQDVISARSRPAVLASRQACLDAHDWNRINEQSPLLSRRSMKIDFDEQQLSVVEPCECGDKL
jgi:hypothetical protein